MIDIKPTKIKNEDKERLINFLKTRDGPVNLYKFLEYANDNWQWEPSYTLLVVTQLYDEGKIGYGKVKTGKPGPRQLCIWLRGGEE